MALALFSSAASGAGRPEVAVVKSDGLTPYAKLVEGFSTQNKADMVEYDLKGNEERAGKIFAGLREKPPAVVLAIGPIAANAARNALANVPVVFVMVPNYEKYGLEAKNVTGISLTLPPRFQLETLHKLAGRVKRVGVVYNPGFSQPVLDAAVSAAETLGLSVVGMKAETPEEVGSALKSLAGKIDALWMIADRTVTHATAVKRIVDFASDQHLPLLALTEGQVKDGALMALAPNPGAIGAQAARLINRIVFEKIDAGALAIQPPEGVDLTVNLGAAKRLGGDCDFATNVLRFASQNGYTIRVFE